MLGEFAYLVGDLRALLAAALAVSAVAIVSAALVLREHLQLERHSAAQEADLERLHDRLFETADSEIRHRGLIEAQGDLIARYDAIGALSYANDAFRSVMGERTRLTPPADTEEMGSTALRMREDGARMFDECVRTEDGERWIAWIETQVRSASGQREVLRVGRDITERVAAERRIEEARMRAEAANLAKSRFLATVSHEIRTPINGVLGMAELLEGTGLSPEQRTYVEAVRSSGEALLSLINEILDFSKIEAGKIELTSEPFDLHRLVESVVELLAPRAQGKGIEIAASIAGGTPRTVIGDDDRIRQVLINLAGNAVKFTERGGVGVEVARGQAGQIVLRVSDTGPGIAPERISSIFEEFERADGSLSSRHEGAGLGLAIARRLVERMQGTIRVTSEPGAGTTFEVALPLPDADRARASRMPAVDLGGQKVLIVSRSPFEAPFLAARLDESGAKVERVASAAAAVRRLGVGGYGLVIADRELGNAATRRIAEAARTGAQRSLVLLSPFERREFGSTAAAGFDGYLMKPVRARSLFARLLDEDAQGEEARGEVALGDKVPAQQQETARQEVAPTATARRRRQARRKARNAAAQANENAVLLAEDNEINALLARRLIEKCGARCDWARDGREALALYGALSATDAPRYRVALIDLRMPGMDGLEVARDIRRRERAGGTGRPLTLIALTANAFAEDREEALKAGFDDFMPKPLDPDRLRRMLDMRAEGQAHAPRPHGLRAAAGA